MSISSTVIQANNSIAEDLVSHSSLNNHTLSYAAACESVQPNSQVLKAFQIQFTQQPQQQTQILSDFWQHVQQQQTPLIEKIDENSSRLIYLWQGAKHNVRLVGGPSNDHEWLTRLPNTDIWFKEVIVNHQFMGSYSFAVDIANIDGYLSNYCPHLNPELKESRQQRQALRQAFQLDPFNPKRLESKDKNLRSENFVALSNAPQFLDAKNFPSHQIFIKDVILESQIFKNQRKVQIYQSKKVDPSQSYITAIFFDGAYYADLLQVPKALDILVEQGKLPPIQAIFIDPVNAEVRPKELSPNVEFSQFFQQEFLPWLDQQLVRDPSKTVLLGSSLGGLSSAYLALENPQQISHVVPLSGSFWWQKTNTDLPNTMSKIIRETPQQPKQHWYISANSYETSRNNNGLSILETSPVVAQDLTAQGHDVVFKQYVGGHSYAIWQVILQDALKHFFKPEQ